MDSKRGVVIAGNWKMNLGREATRAFATTLCSKWKSDLSEKTRAALTNRRLEAILFPSFLSLETLQKEMSHLPITLGAQNAHFEEKGAFTGEISTLMLAEIGVRTTLVAHSERRHYFGETDESARKRSESHLQHGLRVVFCYGETRPEREDGRTHSVLERQLRNGLPRQWNENLVLAYEPVWAIGTGLTATPDQAEEAHAFSRGLLVDLYGKENANRTKILYGGSVTPENLGALLAQPNVDGGLVGGASLKPESFLSMLETAGQRL